jgi:hypothetical protein
MNDLNRELKKTQALPNTIIDNTASCRPIFY